MHVGGFAGASRPFQGASGASGPCTDLQNHPKPSTNAVLRARLKFHAGWSGWIRPPTMAGGGGVGHGKGERGFKGSLKPSTLIPKS